MNEQQKFEKARKEAEAYHLYKEQALAAAVSPNRPDRIDTYAGFLPRGTAQPNRVTVYHQDQCPDCKGQGTIAVATPQGRHTIECQHPYCQDGFTYQVHYTTTVEKFEAQAKEVL